jgi:hypothetical protein
MRECSHTRFDFSKTSGTGYDRRGLDTPWHVARRAKHIGGWERIERDTEQIPWTGCRIWLGASNAKGYGMFAPSYGGGRVYVHRWVYEQVHGPIPEGMFICHKCDTPSCCNPDHLFVGSRSDNAVDMWQKGRHAPPQFDNRGERHGMSKLTDMQVASIKRQMSHMTNIQLSRLYSVHPATISDIRTGATWRHV